MTGMLRVPRTRGALSGVLLVLLGLWGGLIPFAGPYFHFSYIPGGAWTYASGQLWLEILPAAGTVAGGLILLASRVRPVAMSGAWLAAASGAWFAVGRGLSPLWQPGGALAVGTAPGGTVTRALVEFSFFTGLGVLIVFLGALSIGRLSVIGVRDAQLARRREAAAQAPAVTGAAPAADGASGALPRRRPRTRAPAGDGGSRPTAVS